MPQERKRQLGIPADPDHVHLRRPSRRWCRGRSTTRSGVVAAGGKTGRHLVAQALGAGHHLTAVVRDPTRLPVRHDRLAVVVADVLDPAAIGPAVAGADAVVSALGPRSFRKASSIISAGTASILDAMRAAGTSRVVVVSAAPVASDDHGTTLPYGLLVAPMLRALLRRGYADMASMEKATTRSGMDWTILRPPRLTDGPRDRDLPPGQGHQSAPRLPHLQGRPGRGDPGQPGRPRHGQGDHRHRLLTD